MTSLPLCIIQVPHHHGEPIDKHYRCTSCPCDEAEYLSATLACVPGAANSSFITLPCHHQSSYRHQRHRHPCRCCRQSSLSASLPPSFPNTLTVAIVAVIISLYSGIHFREQGLTAPGSRVRSLSLSARSCLDIACGYPVMGISHARTVDHAI